MKTNITLKIDARLLKEIKVLAAETGVSVSGLLANKLEEVVRQRKTYDRAAKRAVQRLHKGFDFGWTVPANRDELHER
jgi:hypothetical protein